MSLTYLSGENYSQDLHDKRHENRLYIQWGSEYRSSLVFELSKVVRMPSKTGLNSVCYSNSNGILTTFYHSAIKHLLTIQIPDYSGILFPLWKCVCVCVRESDREREIELTNLPFVTTHSIPQHYPTFLTTQILFFKFYCLFTSLSHVQTSLIQFSFFLKHISPLYSYPSQLIFAIF